MLRCDRWRAYELTWLPLIWWIGAGPVSADHLSWPERSGPTWDGHASAADARNLPVKWDETSGTNIAWKIALEGQGHSTPVISDNRLWLTAATEDGHQQFVYCLDTATGKTVHHKLLFENPSPEPLGNPINNYAAPSCILESGAVYAHFGCYGTARLDPATAEVVWQRRDLPCRHFRGPGSSPVVFQNMLILTFDGIDRQYVVGLDKNTGQTIWTTPRSTNYHDLNSEGKPKADGDLRKAYHTPGIVEVGRRPELISIGSRAAFGYDPFTGAEIWTIEHDDFNASARPLFLPGMVIINTGSKELIAIRLDASTRGNVTESHVVWRRKKGNSSLSSPVLVDGRIFFVTAQGIIYCVDARSGEEVWAKRIGGGCVASPIVAGKLIYFLDEKGVGTVIRAGSEYDEVAVNQLDEGGRASPAVADGALYIRTFGHLYKISASK